MIVVDLGYVEYAVYDDTGAITVYDSVGSLIEKYHPEIVFGFDPLGEEGIERRDGATVVTAPLAAWLHNRNVPFILQGTASTIGKSVRSVPCFDLAAWLSTLPQGTIVKMDVEGAELALCHRLRRTKVDARLGLLIVETHGDIKLPEMRCPVEEWWM